MFNKKIKEDVSKQKRTIKYLEEEVRSLKSELWHFKNSPRYEVGEMVFWKCSVAMGPEYGTYFIKGEIVDIENAYKDFEYRIIDDVGNNQSVYESLIVNDKSKKMQEYV